MAASEAFVRVRDCGVAIAPEVLPHLFELFRQADEAAPRSQSGLGIGLALVRNLVESHAGSRIRRRPDICRCSMFGEVIGVVG